MALWYVVRYLALNDWCKIHRGAKSGYEKRQLPKFVDDLHIDKLMDYPSFKEFAKAL